MNVRSNTWLVVCLFLLFPQQGSSQSNGDPQSAVQVILESPKAKYAFGEQTVLFVTLRNRSKEAKHVSLSHDLTRSNSDLLKIGIDGKRALPFSRGLFSCADVFVLEARQSLRIRYSGLYLSPGKHKISACYEFRPEVRGAPGSEDLWTGLAESESIEVVVGDLKDMTAQELRAFEEKQEGLIRRLPKLSLREKCLLPAWMVRYMPLTRKLLREMLQDESPDVRVNVLISIGLHADSEYCSNTGLRHSTALIDDVIKLAGSEQELYPKVHIAVALGKAFKSLDRKAKPKAISVLEKYVFDSSGLVAGQAAFSLLNVAPQRAVVALKKKLSDGESLDSDFENLLVQGLIRATGKGDIQEALEALEKRQ
jgi:hypothetical protein